MVLDSSIQPKEGLGGRLGDVGDVSEDTKLYLKKKSVELYFITKTLMGRGS